MNTKHQLQNPVSHLANTIASIADPNAALNTAQNLIADFKIEQTANGPRIIISEDDPRIIGSGQHAIVLKDPNSDFVVKIIGIEKRDSLYYCKGEFAFQASVEVPLELMVDTLKEIFENKDIIIPDHHERTTTQYVTTLSGDKIEATYTYHICPDLTDGGKSQLHEAFGFDFRSINNGQELLRTFSEAWELLCNLPSTKYAVSYNTHRFDNGKLPDKSTDLPIAMQRVFFVIVDPLTNNGTLAAGDLDHVGIVEKRSLLNYLSNLS